MHGGNACVVGADCFISHIKRGENNNKGFSFMGKFRFDDILGEAGCEVNATIVECGWNAL